MADVHFRGHNRDLHRHNDRGDFQSAESVIFMVINLPEDTNMGHLSKVRSLALALMEFYGLTEKGWTFTWDRAKKRAGRCAYGPKEIHLSAPIMALWPIEQCKDTILHEIAHALNPRTGHGPAWRSTCQTIGCQPVACYMGELPKPEPNWIGICPKGHKVYRYRLRKSVRQASCMICNPYRFDSRYLIEWSENV